MKGLGIGTNAIMIFTSTSIDPRNNSYPHIEYLNRIMQVESFNEIWGHWKTPCVTNSDYYLHYGILNRWRLSRITNFTIHVFSNLEDKVQQGIQDLYMKYKPSCLNGTLYFYLVINCCVPNSTCVANLMQACRIRDPPPPTTQKKALCKTRPQGVT